MQLSDLFCHRLHQELCLYGSLSSSRSYDGCILDLKILHYHDISFFQTQASYTLFGIISLISLVEQSSGSGRLKFNDFKDLMCSLKYWQAAFKNHTKEKTGILKAERLRDALLEVGKSRHNFLYHSIEPVFLTFYLKREILFYYLERTNRFPTFQDSNSIQTFSRYSSWDIWGKMELWGSAISYRRFCTWAMPSVSVPLKKKSLKKNQLNNYQWKKLLLFSLF